MLKSVLVYLVPLAITPVLAGLIRIFGGAERGARAAGVAVPMGFIVAWGIFLRPGWLPTDDFSRIGHIAFGAALVGLALDLLAASRLVSAMAAGVVILASAWASVNGGLFPHPPVSLYLLASAGALAVLAFLIVARLDAARARGLTTLVLIAAAALGIAVMAKIVGEPRLALAGAMLAVALIAYAALQGVVSLPVGASVSLGAGSALLALAWALAHGSSDARPALILVPLIFFAEGTARRVPLPAARISAILYPLVLAIVAALPLALAALVAYVMTQS